MTAQEFIDKYPEQSEVFSNCLQDMACPECGNRDNGFRISVTTMVHLNDDGTDQCGDTEWDGKSYCECRECCHTGKAEDFTIEGLDDLLEEKQNEREE